MLLTVMWRDGTRTRLTVDWLAEGVSDGLRVLDWRFGPISGALDVTPMEHWECSDEGHQTVS